MKKKTTPTVTDASPAPAAVKETREEKLRRLASKRVAAAATKIRLIGNLSAYRPTDEQVDKIMEALGECCARIDARLRGSKKDIDPFSL